MRKAVILPIFILLFVGFHSRVHAQTASPTAQKPLEKRMQQNIFKTGTGQGIKNISGTPRKFNLKLCEAHVKVAQLRESNLAKRAGKMQERLDKIATLVKNYYTTKLVPEGKTITSYNQLVADIDAKKAALTPLVAKVEADSKALTCENEAARSQFETFRTDATALISAFKAYRLSLINLIQAVRKANGNLSPTLSPTLTPEVGE